MSYASSSKPRRVSNVVWVIGIVIIGIGAWFFYPRYASSLVESSYTKGHQAYQNLDCEKAIRNFVKIYDFSAHDNGDYGDLAKQEYDECISFQKGVDWENKQYGLDDALIAYNDFITSNGGSPLAEVARSNAESLVEKLFSEGKLVDRLVCQELESLFSNELIPDPETNLPIYHFSCGQYFEDSHYYSVASEMYEQFLSRFPNHALVSEVEAALERSSEQAYEQAGRAHIGECHMINQSLRNYGTWERADNIPRLYFACGQLIEEFGDLASAIILYEKFLRDHPNHALVSEVEAALASTIVAYAKERGASALPAPEVSGTTSSGTTEVIIQNDSPERLRIIFSGPEPHIERLEACSSCQTYTGIGPLFCPKKGPVGHYNLTPGHYDVVAESISNSGIIPWAGEWSLSDGLEYFSCFFIVTR